ncbi:Lysophosphatidylcholine acyltransferase 2 [Perkinsus olseni]|uniref:Lysophosphatidylcholine acyltransferase 2 n=1 Tax=Perkinsus olseni TaxID=32597 RepID=A0A7J6MU65_PEROL|nr:Lysophosphatidylcholine acyltransferase 2 [Perkinsus olseni]
MSTATNEQQHADPSSKGDDGGGGAMKENEDAPDKLMPPSHPYSLRPQILKKKQPDNVKEDGPSSSSRGRTGSAASSIDSAAATIGSAEQERIGAEATLTGDTSGGRRRARSRSRISSNGGDLATSAGDAEVRGKSAEKTPKRRRAGSGRRSAGGVPAVLGVGPAVADVYWVQCSSPSCEKWRIVTKEIFDKFNGNPELPVLCAQLGSACSEPDDAEKYKAPDEQQERERAAKDLPPISSQSSPIPAVPDAAAHSQAKQQEEQGGEAKAETTPPKASMDSEPIEHPLVDKATSLFVVMLSLNPPPPSEASWVLIPGRETKMRLIVNAQDASRLPGEFRSYAVIVPSRSWSGALPNVNWDRLEALRDGQVDESLAEWWFTTGRKLRIAYTVVDGLFRPHAKPADTPRGEPEEGTRTAMSHKYTMRSIILGVVLVPVRMVLLLSSLVIAFPIFCLLSHFGFDKATELLVRTWCLYALVVCFGIVPRVVNFDLMKHYNKESFVMVSNHISCMEILILLFLFYPTFVGKKSLEDTPVVGRVMKSMHCIFVDRLAIKGHQQSTTDTIHKYISAPGKGSPVLLFPEGTTTNGLGLIPFRSGAFCQNVPVLPVAITYPMYRPGVTFDPHWTAIKAVPYAVGLMAQPYTTMRIQILHPESRREGESPRGFADRVREIMAQSLHERLVAGTFPDKVAIEGAIRRGDIPMNVVNEFALRQWKEM